MRTRFTSFVTPARRVETQKSSLRSNTWGVSFSLFGDFFFVSIYGGMEPLLRSCIRLVLCLDKCGHVSTPLALTLGQSPSWLQPNHVHPSLLISIVTCGGI